MGRGANSREQGAAVSSRDQLQTRKLRGQIISIEGLDGAGKSTAIESLRQQISGEVCQLREPGGTPLSELLRCILKGESLQWPGELKIGAKAKALLQPLRSSEEHALVKTINSLLDSPDKLVQGQALQAQLTASEELLLFNAARAQLMDEVITPALAAGKTVLLDRFIDSTVAYQGYGRGLDPAEVRAVCLQATGGRVPDQTLYLKISPQTRKQRIGSRGAEDRIEAAGDRFFERVAAGFDQLASAEERFKVIDAQGTPEQVSQASASALLAEQMSS